VTEINRRTANAFLAGYSWGIVVVVTALYFLFTNNIILQTMMGVAMIGIPIYFAYKIGVSKDEP